MKHIVKTEEPQVLRDFKQIYKRRHKINASYNDLIPNVKRDLKAALLNEQYFICCYCMKRVKQDSSHIEHIKPQSRFPNETLNYHNLLVSCNGMHNANENCGHQKDNWYNEHQFLTPLDSDCEKIYTYNIAGQMDATEEKGKVTIAHLNLNSLLLVRARKAQILLSGLFDNDFEQKKQEIIDYHTTPNLHNQLPPFCMAIIYCINHYG